MKKQKIAFLHADSFPKGGGERVTSDLAPYLNLFDYEIHVITNTLVGDLLTPNDKKYITFHVLGKGHIRFRELSQFVVDVCNNKNIDILINQGTLLRDISYIRQNIHSKVVYCLHGKPLGEVTMMKTNQLKRKPTLINRLRIIYSQITKNIERRVNRRYARTMQNSDAYITLCDAYTEEIRQKFAKYLPKYTMAITNSIPPPCVEYRMEKKKQVIFLGRLTYADKRVDRLLNIWSIIQDKHREWELLIVGDGEERSNLETMAADLNLQRVKFCGWTTTPETYLQDAAIMCVTSQIEGLPIVLAQAQQAGVVPIAFSCSAGVESILAPSGVNGELIENFDIEEYANRLSNLMSNEAYCRQLQANCLKKAEDYKTETKIGPQWLSLLDTLLATK